MVEKWKSGIDNGALFIDFSKAFDTINHNLMLAKLRTYGFSKTFEPCASLLKEQKV